MISHDFFTRFSSFIGFQSIFYRFQQDFITFHSVLYGFIMFKVYVSDRFQIDFIDLIGFHKVS